MGVTQTAAPDGVEAGGRPWQVIGEVTVAPDSDRVVEISVGAAAPGIFAADGIRLRNVDPALPNLQTLRLDDNPLDNRAHEVYLPPAPPADVVESRNVIIDTDALTIFGDDAPGGNFGFVSGINFKNAWRF